MLACFGIGNMTQGNAVSAPLDDTFGGDTAGAGIVRTVLTGLVLIGGITWFGKVTAGFVPLMILLYIVVGTWVHIVNAGNLLGAVAAVFTRAFTGTAAQGGFVGSVFLIARPGADALSSPRA